MVDSLLLVLLSFVNCSTFESVSESELDSSSESDSLFFFLPLIVLAIGGTTVFVFGMVIVIDGVVLPLVSLLLDRDDLRFLFGGSLSF